MAAARRRRRSSARARRARGRGGESNRGVTVPGEVRNYVPVTPEMLKNPPPGDWLIFRRNYQGHSHSPLNQITPANVKNLQLQWVWAMNDSGANQTTPIVHNGIIYLATPSNIVQALDGKTGSLIWETRAGPDQAPGYGGIRSIAIADDKIFLPASNAHMVALSARNGEILWDTNASPEATRVNTSGAIVIGNKVLQGLTGCTRFDGVGCFISAYDINTGKQAWRFYTVPREGEPGSETWGKLPMTFRGGGDTWIAGSYDPDLNLTYWGVSQAKPWNFLSRKLTLLDKTLFANSTVALNPDTGKLAWHYQHAPAESFDLDEVFERVLVDIGDQKVSFSAGKAGVLWKLDRRTGQFLGYKEMVYQNVYDRIDPKTGVPSYRPEILEMQIGKPIFICPSTAGGKNWQAMSYYPPAGLLIAPLSQSCMDFTARERRDDRRRRRLGRRPRVQALAEQQGADGQARGLRREDDAGGVEVRAARAVPDGGVVYGRRPRVHRRSRSLRARAGRKDRPGAVADAPRHVGAGISGELQRRRPAVHRGDGGARRRQPAQRAGGDRARHQDSAERTGAVRLRAASVSAGLAGPDFGSARCTELRAEGRVAFGSLLSALCSFREAPS